MATLTLDRFWLNRMDTGAAVSARTLEDRDTEYSNEVEVRTRASGRQVAVTVEGERGRLSRTLALVDLATITTLREWKGIAVQARDHRGQVWYGVFGSVTPIELKEPNLYHVAITIQTVSV